MNAPRDQVLLSLPEEAQIEILKWAQDHGIQPNDPAWLLVSMLGHVRAVQETLPARILAAGDRVKEGIKTQRLAEQAALARSLDEAVEKYTARLAEQALTQAARMSHQYTQCMNWAYKLAVFGSAVCLAIVCFFAGVVTSGAYPVWISNALNVTGVPLWLRVFAAIFSVPAGWIALIFLFIGFGYWTWVEFTHEPSRNTG